METWKADGTGAKLSAQMDQLEISCPVTDQMSGLKGADLKADGIIVTLRDRLLIQTDLLWAPEWMYMGQYHGCHNAWWVF